jgi:ubiquitin-like protein Pup
MSRVYKSRSPSHKPTKIIESDRDRVRRAKQKLAQHIEDELDELLDDIDAVLEENAEEFVTDYVQKGGQ